jgi:processive 1,2-diacylglycerol beta-glucosyltransferase
VLTDFVAHRQWVYPDVDRYFAPVDEVGDGLAAIGVPADRLVVSGIPVDPAFAAPQDRAACRAQLGLPGDAPVVLVTGGMRGLLGGVAEACEVLAGLPVPLRAVVVCGEHQALARALRARFAGDGRFRILGRVEAMERAMGAADLVVTKAGAVTCAEALALGRPLVLYRSLRGQEVRNEGCLARAGAAVRARGRADLAAHLTALLAEPERRAAMAAGGRRLRRPDAARTVAKEVLAMAGAR